MNRAVEAGHPEALFRAAKVYLDADGDFMTGEKGVRFLTRAADNGSTQAMLALGDLALVDSDIPFWQQAAQLRIFRCLANRQSEK